MAIEYGLQMYSVRDITGSDMEGALKAVAEMGYKYVEYAGFAGHSAEQIKEWQGSVPIVRDRATTQRCDGYKKNALSCLF